jgi:gluconolactonase
MIALLLLVLTVGGSNDGLIAGPVETVATGFGFTEGPLWIPGTGLVFSDLTADAIFRPDKTFFRKPSSDSNGLTLDREGRLIVCEQASRRITRVENDGTVTVVADAYLGRKFNSPNDVVVRSDGMIFFTDPPYGLRDREPELPFSGVYCVMPGQVVKLLSVYFKHPNGLAFSPDEKTLYIGDSGDGFIEVFEVAADGTLANARLFARLPTPDGMKTDELGNLWSSSEDGVRVYKSNGELVTTVQFPASPANCGFGDEDGKTLYVTARQGVYRLRCSVRGVRSAR